MRQNMGNVAVARPLMDSTAVLHSKKQKKLVHKGLPPREKWLYLSSVIFCVLLAFAVLSQMVVVSKLNVAISYTENRIQQVGRIQQKLEMNKRELESVERMREYAKSKGMELKPQKILPLSQP